MNSVAETIPAEGGMVNRIKKLHDRIFASIESRLEGWGIQFGTRLIFAAVLFVYYINSGMTKLGDGMFGVFVPSAGAFAQILPPIAEQYFYDTTAIPFFPWHLIVIAGTLAEFILPVLIVLGLFTRMAALGMIGFVVVQTVVDIAFHGAALGSWFNAQSGELLDQRVLWVFLLLILVVKGAGTLSIDHWLSRLQKS